jgi:hypothetical protein
MAGENGYNAENFRMKPCAVSFGGTILGGTDGPVTITEEVEYYESKCNQAGNMVLAKRVIAIKTTIKAKFKEITTALKAVMGDAMQLDTSIIGKNIFEDGKELLLSEIGEGSTLVHEFPKAIALKDTNYEINGIEEHGIELTFEAIASADGVVHQVLEGGAGE